MLFTFAFFWLIWTSESAKYVFWLPVVALFVGMFVKTGETVIFGLGMRVLAAAQAFLPLETAPANRVATDKGDASSPSSGGRGKT